MAVGAAGWLPAVLPVVPCSMVLPVLLPVLQLVLLPAAGCGRQGLLLLRLCLVMILMWSQEQLPQRLAVLTHWAVLVLGTMETLEQQLWEGQQWSRLSSCWVKLKSSQRKRHAQRVMTVI